MSAALVEWVLIVATIGFSVLTAIILMATIALFGAPFVFAVAWWMHRRETEAGEGR